MWFIGTYNKKIRIYKMGENSSSLTKLYPNNQHLFWIYFSSLDIIKFDAYHKSYTNVMFETQYMWNATKIWKSLQNMCSWCWVPLILWFNSFYFVTVNSTFDSASLCFLCVCGKFIDRQRHFLDESLNCSNPLS